MKTLSGINPDHHLACFTKTAEEVMTINPMSISRSAMIADASDFLTAKGVSAAPVIDEAGRPVGVVSLADIVRHVRLIASSASEFGNATVEKVMTPVVYSARLDTPLMSVIDHLLECKVHRLFVVDEHGVLIGVISTLDVLRSLLPDASRPSSARTEWDA